MCSEKEAGKRCPAQRRQGQTVQDEAAVVLDFVRWTTFKVFAESENAFDEPLV